MNTQATTQLQGQPKPWMQLAKSLRQLGRRKLPSTPIPGATAPYAAVAPQFEPPSEILFCIRQHLGYDRENQEDSAAQIHLQCLSNGRLEDVRGFVEADGCGGNEGGELASAEAVTAVVNSICGQVSSTSTPGILCRSDEARELLLEGAFEDANAAIFQRVAAQPAFKGAASTAVCLLLTGGKASVAWVGDSRCFLYRDGALTRLTTDHNRAQCLVDAGILTPEEVHTHPARNHLTKALGMRPEVFPDISHGDIKPGDLYLLTTDGFHEGLTSEQICEACRLHLAAKSVTQDTLCSLAAALEEESLSGYGTDNLTATFIYVKPTSVAGAGIAVSHDLKV